MDTSQFSDLRILLIARKGAQRDQYLAALHETGVRVTVASSFKKLSGDVADQLFHGVMVDLATKIRALNEDKDFIHNIIGNFPMAQLKLEKKTGKISVFLYGQTRGGFIEEFLYKECLTFKPRKFRSHARKPIHFNVVFIDAPDLDSENASRSITMNVSRGGCFIFSAGSFNNGEEIRFVLKELDEDAPVKGIVRYGITWGDAMRVPGVGLEFTDIDESQLLETGLLNGT